MYSEHKGDDDDDDDDDYINNNNREWISACSFFLQNSLVETTRQGAAFSPVGMQWDRSAR